ncbi:TerF [Oceanobacillus picturae]|uniref:TerF n=1 Tax=Oceanobacillus picturae TaxID=171693 RepID=A0A0U9H8Q6_9BACI|nr:TerF [Oceanobacillus picturae]
MPKIRPPRETWFKTIRPIVWKRDGGMCSNCGIGLSLYECNIDHIISGVRGSNKLLNLRTLCKKCHVLRLDHNHRGMIQAAIKNELIPPNWRDMVWDEDKE